MMNTLEERYISHVSDVNSSSHYEDCLFLPYQSQDPHVQDFQHVPTTLCRRKPILSQLSPLLLDCILILASVCASHILIHFGMILVVLLSR